MRATQVMTNSDSQIATQITPVEILLLNEINLPFTLVLLEPSFPIYCSMYIFEYFIIYEQLHAIFLGESGRQPLSMFPNALNKIVGNADIKRAVALACQNINVINLLHQNCFNWVARIRGP